MGVVVDATKAGASHMAATEASAVAVRAAESCVVAGVQKPASIVSFKFSTVHAAFALTIVYTLILMAILWSCGCLRCPRRRRNMRVQSMVTYRRKLETPRFQPLGKEFEHGAWSD